jgi:hypothetical protein
MRRSTGFLLALAIVATIVGITTRSASAAAVLVDDFADGVDLNTFLGPSSATNDGPHGGVIGFFRDTTLTVDSGMAIQIFYSPVSTQTLVFDGFPGSTGTYNSVYDGFGLNGNLNRDLTASGNDRFQVAVIDANGNGNLAITVVDTDGISSAVTHPIIDGVMGKVDYLFSSYSSDLTKVRSITVTLNSTSVAADFTLGSIRAIPEPASIGLIGLGSLLVLRRRRRDSRIAN